MRHVKRKGDSLLGGYKSRNELTRIKTNEEEGTNEKKNGEVAESD
ncbi:hypothetical protein ACU8KH_03372 [Lachancea thermotolerans]